LSSLAEVRRLAEDLRREHTRLDVLINNAGIGAGGALPGRCESRDGHELRFAVNYLAGFLLTRLLLPLLKAGAPARIVNVASAGQQAIDFSDCLLTRGYSGRRAYCQSKLAQILFTFDLADELSSAGVTVNALHPATYMDTAMVRGDGVAPVTSVDEGADAILALARSPEMAGRTGLYFDGLRPSRAAPQAYDAAARTRLRALSFELTGLSPAAA
jgi:NAD(P)-dependent dehydrogenase (short-subunit alcohol dehydrogenase family)